MIDRKAVLVVVACSLLIISNTSQITLLKGYCNVKPSASDETEKILHSSSSVHEISVAANQTKKPFFDPFSDLTFEPVLLEQDVHVDDRISYYSAYHCVGTSTVRPNQQSEVDSAKHAEHAYRPNYVSRSCYYRNLYYRPEDQTFHYFSSKGESDLWDEAKLAGDESFYELQSRMNVSIDPVLIDAKPGAPEIRPWRPILHQHEDIPESINMVGPSNSHFLLYRPFHSFNIGHLIWDDFLTLFSLLDMFHKGEDPAVQPVPFFVELPFTPERRRQKPKNYGGYDRQFRCSPYNFAKWNLCVKVFKRLFPLLMGIQPDECSGDILRTGNWLLGTNKIGRWNYADPMCETGQDNSGTNATKHRHHSNQAPCEYVILPHVLVGTGRLGYSTCQGDCAIGQGQQFYRFRNFMMRNALGPGRAMELSKRPPKGYITFSLPGHSSRPDMVYWFEKEIEQTRLIYGNNTVKVVDMSELSMQDQIELAADSAVLFTNHGGGGAVSIFLDKASAAFVYWHGRFRMDSNFYESAGYFRTIWVDFF